jgi:S-adenosylmethionine/arginine decarboxylase-like enzyme
LAKIVKPFGVQLLLDCYECSHEAIDNLDIGYTFLEEAVEVLGVHKQAPPYIFRTPTEFEDKAGLSGVVMLVESSIVLHTLCVRDYVSIDYYTCSIIDRYKKSALIELAQDTFNPTHIETQFLKRGRAYYGQTA